MKSVRTSTLIGKGLFFLILVSYSATAFSPRNAFSRVVSTSASTQSIGGVATSAIGRNPTSLNFGDEDSEWYSPPPSSAPKKEVSDEKEHVFLPRGVKPKVTVIRAKIDLDEFLAEDDRLCLVKFHASWCKSCQKFNLQFKQQIAPRYADWEKDGEVVKENSVRIAEVEWGSNTQLCKSLGVTKLPSIFFYSNGMKIDSLSAGPSRFFKVRDAVKRYASMTPAEIQFEAKLEQGKKLMEEAARRARFEEVAKARHSRRGKSKTSPGNNM